MVHNSFSTLTDGWTERRTDRQIDRTECLIPLVPMQCEVITNYEPLIVYSIGSTAMLKTCTWQTTDACTVRTLLGVNTVDLLKRWFMIYA